MNKRSKSIQEFNRTSSSPGVNYSDNAKLPSRHFDNRYNSTQNQFYRDTHSKNASIQNKNNKIDKNIDDIKNLIHQSNRDHDSNQHKFNSPRLLSADKISNRKKLLPDKADIKVKTLILDLDETLVHSSFKPFNIRSDIILKIQIDGKIHDIHVLIRPGTSEFLEKLSSMYELVIFTASLSKVKLYYHFIVCKSSN